MASHDPEAIRILNNILEALDVTREELLENSREPNQVRALFRAKLEQFARKHGSA